MSSGALSRAQQRWRLQRAKAWLQDREVETRAELARIDTEKARIRHLIHELDKGEGRPDGAA